MTESVEDLFKQGVDLYYAGNLLEALEIWEKAIVVDPNHEFSWNAIGSVLSNLGRYEEALEALEKAIQLDPNYKNPWFGIGNVLDDLGRYEEALVAYEKAIQLDSNFNFPWNGKGNVLRNLGRYEEALVAYEKAIQLDSDFSMPWNGKGNVLRDLGRYEEALEAYEKAIQLDPNYKEAWNGKGNVLKDLGRYEEALLAYEKSIQLDSNYWPPWNGKGNVLMNLKLLDQARACLTRSLLLVTDRDIKMWANTLLHHFHHDLSAPMFLYRMAIERQLTSLIPSSKWSQLFQDVERVCEPAQQLLQFIAKGEHALSEMEGFQLIGLIHFYMEDPPIAHQCFEQVDNLDDSNLMGQFYLLRSMSRYCEPCEEEWGFALDQIHGLKAQSEVSEEQWYYAGQLLRWHAEMEGDDLSSWKRIMKPDYASAIEFFERSDSFLPSLYIRVWLHDQALEIRKRDALIERVLKLESERFQQTGRPQFLLGVALESFDLNNTHWHHPVFQYAFYCEIFEGLQCVWGWMDSHPYEVEAWLPYELRSPTTTPQPKPAVEVWQIVEQWKQQLRQELKDNQQQGLQKLYEHVSTMQSNPRWADITGSSREVETQLGELIQMHVTPESWRAWDELIHYYLLSQKVSVEGAILLRIFGLWVVSLRQQSRDIKYRGAIINAITTIISNTLMSLLQFNVPFAILASAGMVASGTLVAESFLDQPQHNLSTFERIRNSFTSFVIQQQETLGAEAFQKRYFPE